MFPCDIMNGLILIERLTYNFSTILLHLKTDLVVSACFLSYPSTYVTVGNLYLFYLIKNFC